MSRIDDWTKILGLLGSYRSLAVWSAGSPDPDFLACAEVVRRVGDMRNCQVKILGAKPLSLEVNRRLIRDFFIPYKVASAEDFRGVEGIVILDYARVARTKLAPDLPVLLHVDHHERLPPDGDDPLDIVDTEIGAVATLFVEMLLEQGEEPFIEILKGCATPLYYAIMVDTDHLVHASHRDREMATTLKGWLDEAWLSAHMPVHFTESQQKRLQTGIDQATVEGGVWLCGLGVLPLTERDFIAIAADLLIRRKNAELVGVYALIRSRKHLTLDVSLRAHNRETHLLPLIQSITHEGGARPHKGAYQINMDYFLPLAESDDLWHLVEESTRHQIMTAFQQPGVRGRWSALGTWLKRLGRMFEPD
jgi:nanoRNase/pAp phosphatase (c-di-AMP/oligoRNAs hydrolase)